ncbi:MAG: phosphodiester glycosidase family protein [Syntrophomonadaceae bacterium]|nr:phosphodiester glycosidase family protein [Syntrophomonadaceae bacterium]
MKNPFIHGGKAKSRKLIIILTSMIGVGIILLLLANRYLIEHVEIADVQSTASAQISGSGTGAGTNGSTQRPAGDETYTSDQWNYRSDSKTISIKKVVTGSGNNTITYYVAEVELKESASLQSAFAKNQFGTNIIEYTSQIAEDNDAILAINGDYYGFRNNGILIRNGVIYRNSPARTGLAIYADGDMKVYDETQTDAQTLLAQGVVQTLSFGPALVSNYQTVDNDGRVEIDTNWGNRSIQGSNPRTGIGIIAPSHYVLVVVDGRMSGYSKGMTLEEFAAVFTGLGCAEAYNLDGGGSSEMYFMGRVVNNPLGKNQERGTSDILYIK